MLVRMPSALADRGQLQIPRPGEIEMRHVFNGFAVLAAAVLTVATSQAAILYDASVNTTPDAQGWAFVTNPLFGAQASQSVDNGVLALNTRPEISDQAGYFSKLPALSFSHPNNPIMDLSASPFSIEFSMRQLAGSDAPDVDPLAAGQRNRGGFAVIAISEDLTGLELQFQTDGIVALDDVNTAFPVGEALNFDTTDAVHDYELILSTEGYRLLVDESLVLQGPLRDYWGISPIASGFPYSSPSFFFFGDDTGRGEALTELTRFEVSAVPEPAAAWLFAVGLSIVGFWRRHTIKARHA